MIKLAKILKEFSEIDEDNTTGADGQYLTPNAFKDTDDESDYIREATYSDFKGDSSMSEKQKINNSILEINRMLIEMERRINHASKLKKETGADQTVYWKNTTTKFQKIGERLNRISNKLREINT